MKNNILFLFLIIISITLLHSQEMSTNNPDAGRAKVENRLEEYGRLLASVNSAISDELSAEWNYNIHEFPGGNYKGDFYLGCCTILIEPIDLEMMNGEGVFYTHVMYPHYKYGWVVRGITIDPRALSYFTEGYTLNGPGSNLGFNCTHGFDNCKIQDLDFDTVLKCFNTWWKDKIDNPFHLENSALKSYIRDAKKRNLIREQLMEKLYNLK